MKTKQATLEQDNWDIVLKPKNKWYNIDIKGIWRYRDLIWLFVRRDFVAQYKQTILGPLWMVIQPLLYTVFYALIFGRIAKFPTDGLPPAVFVMCALVPWSYFADCITKVGGTFTSNSAIFGKVYFPRLVLPVSIITSSLFKFLIQFALLILLLLYYSWFRGADITPNFHILYIPLIVIFLAGFGLAIGLIVSSLVTRYRDLNFLLGFIIQFLMYGSSVVIAYDVFGPRLQSVLQWNPLVWSMEAFRYALTGAGTWSWNGIFYGYAFMILLLAFAIVLFSKVEKTFMDTV